MVYLYIYFTVNFVDSITSNDAFSDDDESLVFDNLDEVDTPEAADHNIEVSGKQHQSSSGNQTQGSSTLQQHGGAHNQSSQQHPFSGSYSGISTPPGLVSNQQPQPLPAHLPIHPHPQTHPSMNIGMPESQQPHLPSSENVLQNPIDKLYLMQDSYFTQM